MGLLMIQQRSVESMQQAHNYKKKIVVVTVTDSCTAKLN